MPRPHEPAEVNHCLTEFQPVTTDKVMNLINSIKLYKSSGIRDISSRLLKDGLSALPEQIKFIFNLSLSKCSIPESWKEAKVTPIPKKVICLTSITLGPLVKRLLLEKYWRNI